MTDMRQFVIIVSTIVSLQLGRVDSTDSDNDYDFNLDNMLSSIETMFEYLGDPDGCSFKCKNDAVPILNPHHVPSSNGCGVPGMVELDTSLMPAVTKCCNNHDVCYDTCNKIKENCDDQFRQCLTNICHKLKQVFSKDAVDGCMTTADLMYAGVMTMGCKSYRDSQNNACLCQRGKSTPNKKNEL